VLCLGGVWDVVGDVDVKASGPGNHAIHQSGVALASVVSKAGIQQHETLVLGRHDNPPALRRYVCLVQSSFHFDNDLIGVVLRNNHRGCIVAHNGFHGSGGSTSLEQTGKILVSLVRKAVGRRSHGSVHQVRACLHTVHIVDLHIEVVALVDDKGLVAGG